MSFIGLGAGVSRMFAPVSLLVRRFSPRFGWVFLREFCCKIAQQDELFRSHHMKTLMKGLLVLAVVAGMSGCIPMPGMHGGPHFGNVMPTNQPTDLPS